MDQFAQIKIFSGTQTGASLPLKAQTPITIGTSYDNDIYLDLPSDISLSATFSISESSTLIFHDINLSCNEDINHTNLDNSDSASMNEVTYNNLCLNNSEIIVVDQEYSIPCFLQLAGIRFAIGDAEDINAWVSAKTINDDAIENDASDAEIDNSMKNPGDVFGFDTEADLDSNESDINEIQISGVDDSKLTLWDRIKLILGLILVRWWKEVLPGFFVAGFFAIKKFFSFLYKKLKIWLYVLLLIILMILVGSPLVISYLKQAKKVTAVADNNAVIAKNIKKIFMELPGKYANLSFQALPQEDAHGNLYQISGLVVGLKDIDELKNVFKNYSSIIDFKLITADQSMNKIKAILLDAGVKNLQVTYDPSSQRIALSGLVDGNLNVINDAQITISNQMPMVGNIDISQIFEVQQLKQDISTAIGDLSGFLQVDTDIAHIKVKISGYLTTVQLAKLKDNLSRLQQRYQSLLKVELDIKDALLALPFTIYSIFNGDQPYIVTENGQHIYVGGEVGGFKLAAITNSRIIFTGKYTLEVPISQIGAPSGVKLNNDDYSNDTSDIVDSISPKTANGRAQILQEELSELQKAITTENAQLNKLIERKKAATDTELSNFLQEQIDNLQDDIQVKQHELSNYNTTNNPSSASASK